MGGHGWPWVAMGGHGIFIADPKGFSDTWGGENLEITLKYIFSPSPPPAFSRA